MSDTVVKEVARRVIAVVDAAVMSSREQRCGEALPTFSPRNSFRRKASGGRGLDSVPFRPAFYRLLSFLMQHTIQHWRHITASIFPSAIIEVVNNDTHQVSSSVTTEPLKH
jgi:hypothetical protein